jgi:peptidoglycan/LPS O-acetylase OafA/YrhL
MSDTYRPDIDMLRAFAVVVVLLFHLDVSGFSYGFLGVDIFFVVSGYLISTIIFKALDNGQFSLGAFYARRVRRLLPPLVVTVLVTMIAASMIMTPYDLNSTGRSAVSSLFSFSNFVFLSEVSYWDQASELKPLLHTWSLAIEEQFYLVWPSALIVIHRYFPRRAALLAVVVLGAVLTWWMGWIGRTDAAFYLLPFRTFEFAAGALLAGATSGAKKDSCWVSNFRVINVLAIGVLVGGVVSFNDSPLVPLSYGFPVTAATVTVLFAGSLRGGSEGNRRQHLGVLYLGRISYALYLVHWPLISLYKYKTGLELSLYEQLFLGMASCLGAFVLHHGVERRYYRRSHEEAEGTSPLQHRALVFSLLIAAIAVGFSFYVWLSDNSQFRQFEFSSTQIIEGRQNRFVLTNGGCRIDLLADLDRCAPSKPIQILFIGNSHEPDGVNWWTGAVGERADIEMVSFGTINKCEDLVQQEKMWATADANCQMRLDALFHEPAAVEFDLIVYAANKPFSSEKEDLFHLLSAVADQYPEAEVVLMGGYINTKRDCPLLIDQIGPRACVQANEVSYFETDPMGLPMYAKFAEIADYIVDRVDLHCVERNLADCEMLTKDGTPFSWDKHHWSLEFSLESGQEFARRYPELLEEIVMDRTQ